MTTFDMNGVRKRLAPFGTRQLVAFAAFWPQRLMPMYRRFSTLEREVDVLNALLLTLADEPAPTTETISRLKADAENHTLAALVDSMVDLSEALNRLKPS